MRSSIRPLVLATAVIGAILLSSASPAWADDLTPQQQQVIAQKRAVECEDCTGGGGYPASAHVAANQTPQSTGWYCGPAAVHEALDALGISLSQSAAASALHTTTDGTAWSGGGTAPSGYPVPDVLNAHESRNYYVPQFVAAPGSSVIKTYEKDLALDIYALGVPLIGDAWETRTSDHHLVGHPTDRTIFHWFEIRGYEDSGASTMYEDSVHNARSVSWYASVPAYSTLPSSWLVSIVSGRGYVW
jgi:hypothetical protein